MVIEDFGQFKLDGQEIDVAGFARGTTLWLKKADDPGGFIGKIGNRDTSELDIDLKGNVSPEAAQLITEKAMQVYKTWKSNRR